MKERKDRRREYEGRGRTEREELYVKGRENHKNHNFTDKKSAADNRHIMFITYIILLLFAAMVIFLVRFMLTESSTRINSQYNKRAGMLARKISRGKIISSDGKTLAYTVTDSAGNDTRIYPYKNAFCHVVGRVQKSMTGLELSQCFPLLTSDADPITKLKNDFRGKKNEGDSCITTLDTSVQLAAYRALGNFKGAAVAMDPKTGKILAMVSKPDYNPETVSENWDALNGAESADSALLNRASQGLYPPGSTFKVITAAAFLRSDPKKAENYLYRCAGSAVFGNDAAIKCFNGEVHGEVNLKKSLAESCNCSFANIGLMLKPGALKRTAEKFMFNKSLPVDFPYSRSSFKLGVQSSDADTVQTAIGQGKTLVTPLQNCMIASAIADGGVMMKPYLVSGMESPDGRSVKKYSSQSMGRVIKKSIARRLNNYMQAVVTQGTASSLRGHSYRTAGKTGTAEFDSSGTSHAWFIGFAPADDPKIAVSVVVEGAGTGSQYAVPVAGKMIEAYLGK